MKRYPPGKCPNTVKVSERTSWKCGYSGYIILHRGEFNKESGYDPLAMQVKCCSCGCEYYLFPVSMNAGGVER